MSQIKTVEIEGVTFYPDVAKKMKVEDFVKAHITLEVFKKLGDKAEKKLKEIHKKL